LLGDASETTRGRIITGLRDHHPELKSDWLLRGDADLALAAVVTSAHARVVVASDFDGTLAEIVARPDLAQPAPGALAVLGRLVESAARVLVISGREESDLARLLPLAGLGLHGDFGLQQPTPAELAALADCERRLREEFGSDSRVMVESKRAALSLHFRSHPAMASELLRRAVSLAAEHGLLATPGRAVVEIRPRRASKATALDRLLQGLGPDAVVYAGDDEADREVFGLLALSSTPSLAIGVDSSEVDPGVFRECDLLVDGPRGVIELFRRLAERLDRSGRADPAVGA